MSPVVQLENIHKIYDSGEVKVHAVRGVTIDIQKGEFVALMGASGSGKSTLMNLLGCLDRPTSGRYRLDGTDIARLDANALADLRNRKLGFVFQGFNLLARTTARENVELPMLYGQRRLSRSAQMRTRAMHCLEIVAAWRNRASTTSRASFPAASKQRVAIARSLINEPQVLLADEPDRQLSTPRLRSR